MATSRVRGRLRNSRRQPRSRDRRSSNAHHGTTHLARGGAAREHAAIDSESLKITEPCAWPGALAVHEIWKYPLRSDLSQVDDDVRPVEANGQAAVSFGRPIDDKACQIKGTFVSSRAARPGERAEIVAQFESFLTNLEEIGIPRRLAQRWPTWPCTAIRLKATAVFTQTPGPGAGEPVR